MFLDNKLFSFSGGISTAPKGSRGAAAAADPSLRVALAQRQVHAPKVGVTEINSLGLRDRAEGRGELNWMRSREPQRASVSKFVTPGMCAVDATA